MMAMNKKILEQEPGEIEALLPWHAAGTLSARDTRRVEDALARDPALARQYAVIREEYAETIALNESLGAPSARAMQKLFATIDAEPARKPSVSLKLSARIAEFFAGLSPRAVAYSAVLGALAIFTPQLLIYQGIVWKDVMFANCAVAGFVLVAWAGQVWPARGKRWALLITALVLMAAGAILVVMVAMFLLGFVMDAFEIIFVVVPIVAPA